MALPATPPPPATAFSAEFAAPVALRAPVLDASFAGLGTPPPGQGDVIPPDTMGAVGPNHLVSLLNSEFGVFDKQTGALRDRLPLESFWAGLVTPPGTPADFPFDPKVLYDQHSGRFVAVTLDCTVAPNSWVLIAVSSTSNPLDTWYKWAIDADLDNDAQRFLNYADYPGLGVDDSNIYVNANMFSNRDTPQYSKIWVIPKAQLLTGSNPITWTEFRAPPGSDFSMQPAHTFGTPGAEYFVFEDFANPPALLLAKIDNVAGNPVWRAPATVLATDPYAATSFLPGAPQAGDTRTIDTSDTRLLNAVYRNGHVWTTHTVAVNGKTEVAWYRINPGTGTAVAQGRIRDTVRGYYYPSIAVNRDDVAAIGFSGSSTLEYAGGYYTVIRPPHAAHDPVALLKAGEASYYKTLSGTDNRWGDFSATMVDPADDVTFWTLQEYAMTPESVTLASRWGTWWGKFHLSDVAAPAGLTAKASPSPQVILDWSDVAGNTGFRVERRLLPGGGPEGDYSVIANPGANATTFTDNVSTGLRSGFTYAYRVQAYNATGGSYSNEAFASTVAPPPPPSGGGGGGCLAVAPSRADAYDVSSIPSLALLFLPAAVCGWIRLRRSGKR